MKSWLRATGIALWVVTCGIAHAAWPDHTISLLVPFPPGGSTDTVARAIAVPLQKSLGQSVVINNRAGATGTIGALLVKRSPPDGYTFLVTSLGPLVVAPHLIKPMEYDALTDFDFLTVLVQAPNVLVVPADSPYRTVADVIAYERANPNKMTFASSGNGSSDHLTVALFWQKTGTSGIHVPYKGGSPAITDLLGGHVDASFQNVNAVLSHIKGGKLRALAVTGQKRSPVLPDVPTMDEAGVKGVDVYSWQAIVAPKGMPADVRSRVQKALTDALADPDVKQQFTSVGLEIVGNTPAQFAAFEKQEYERWKTVIETGHIVAD